uniref:Mitochondrial transcription termination factor-like family-2 n=1 Tax=Oryza meyeriana var. granulata TaxID=110450 RepID=B9V0L3_9ORYZ|nr:mitochondrial transcription termination factor-like family-2 [Oryza meyeriana var. granulata]
MLHLREHLFLPLLRAATHFPTSAVSHPSASAASSSSSSLHLSRLLLSTAAAAARSAATATPFSVEDYLAAACGLTGAQALKASKKISHLKSASNPDAVLALLSGVGLSRTDFAVVVASHPLFLCARAHNIARRIASLRDRVGLSDPQICSLLLAGGARGLRTCDIASRLEFWIPFLGSFEMLLKILKSNNAIVTADIEKVIKPTVALFQECGLTVRDIVKMAHLSRMLTTNPKRVETSVQRADELGVPRSSSRFKYMLAITCCISEDKVTARMRFLSSTLSCSRDKIRDIVCKNPAILGMSEENISSKIEFLTSTLGCSKEKICAAVCKKPNILGFSENNIRSKIEFLTSTLGCSKEKICAMVCKKPGILGLSDENLRRKINFMTTEVGLEPGYIVERPWVLAYSLEKRIVPRHSVVKILRTMGLMKEFFGFCKLLTYCDEDFHARYIDPYKQTAPMLTDFYSAACVGKMPDEVHL